MSFYRFIVFLSSYCPYCRVLFFIIIIFVYFFSCLFLCQAYLGPIQPTLQAHQEAQMSPGPTHKSHAWPSLFCAPTASRRVSKPRTSRPRHAQLVCSLLSAWCPAHACPFNNELPLMHQPNDKARQWLPLMHIHSTVAPWAGCSYSSNRKWQGKQLLGSWVHVTMLRFVVVTKFTNNFISGG